MDALLNQLSPELKPQVQLILAERDRLQSENNILRQAVRLLQLEKYGKHSEKLSDNQLNLLDQEPSVTTAEVQAEAIRESACPSTPPTKRPANQNHPGRQPLPAHLERREVIIPCPESQKVCPHCGEERPVMDYEVSEELDMDPVHYFVRVIKREKRGSHCLPETGVATAPCPPKIIAKSKLSNEVIIDVVVRKYDEHMPVYRQALAMERDAGLDLSRQTLVDAIMAVGQLLRPVVQVLSKELIGGGYIQADETPVPCQSERTRGKNHQAYMWEYSRPGGPVVFDFRMGRGRDGPREFLKGFAGILQCDGYAAYDDLGPGIAYAGCWSHARRPFHKAHLLAPQDPLPLEVIGQIQELYRIEEEARTRGLSAQERLALRQAHSAPVLDKLKARIMEIAQQALPASQLGKACKYTLGQWTRLTEFLKDGRIAADNNSCENGMRKIAIGRRNWLHIGSEQAGPKVANIASVVETCYRLGVNVREYLRDVLPKLPEWPTTRVAELSPLTWKPASPQP
jgi:transposase